MLGALMLAWGVAATVPAGALGEQGSQPTIAAAGGLDGGTHHTCALLVDAGVRCWGLGSSGQLGYGNTSSVGDDETPGSVAPVDLGPGRTATAISAGDFHTCAVLDDGSVRCWGLGGDGQLGYGDKTTIGDDETPGSVAPVNLGPGRTAKAISAGAYHTCAVLDDDSVRCWGLAGDGQLGYGDTNTIGDDETPDTAGPVRLGLNRAAKAISAGLRHTCAVLDDANLRCWGSDRYGQLGYGNRDNSPFGDDEAPDSVAPVNLGPNRTAVAISAGALHTCARLDDASLRCWGLGSQGRLGYGDTTIIGDDEPPGSVGPVDVGPGRGVTAISGGATHSCARLDDGSVRCWGYGANGRLGYCNEHPVGDDEPPGSVGPVDLEVPGSSCPVPRRAIAWTAPGTGGPQSGGDQGAPGGPAPAGPPAVSQGGSSRGPGPVKELRARAASKTKIKLSFRAAISGGPGSPPARAYVVKQSRRPIRSSRDLARARALCKGSCRFPVPSAGTKIILTVTDLSPRTTYYYAVAARDETSKKVGPRSRTVRATTR